MSNDRLSDIGEVEALRRLCMRLPAGRYVRTGAGDDCAVIGMQGLIKPGRGRPGAVPRSAHDLLLTSDPVIESVHFKAGTPSPAIGHKALARVLSDIAAMGGKPLWCLVDVVAPVRTRMRRITGIYSAMSKLARRHGVSIAGGDLARGPVLELHVFCVGTVPKGKAVLRSGAKPGHKLFVTGSLGGAGSGKHLHFEPRLREGQWIADHGWASAMIDISDGLASDLRRLNERSGTGAELLLDSIPVSRAVTGCRGRDAMLARAFSDGEDYELLFTVPARKAALFWDAWKRRFALSCKCIGTMTARRGHIECIDHEGKRSALRGRGYEHMRAN